MRFQSNEVRPDGTQLPHPRSLACSAQLSMNTVKNSLRHPECPISPLLSRLFCAPLDHTWFALEHLSNRLLTERPKLGYLNYRIVLLIGQINRQRRSTWNRTEAMKRLCGFSSEFGHGMPPTLSAYKPGRKLQPRRSRFGPKSVRLQIVNQSDSFLHPCPITSWKDSIPPGYDLTD